MARIEHKENGSLYEAKKGQLLSLLSSSSSSSIHLEKKTASNLFRYWNQNKKPDRSIKSIAIDHFNNVLSIDTAAGILDVEGLTPYEKIVDETLRHGFLPTVAPELKHITVGGAIVGIGIESTGFKYGFVNDGLLEAEVLLGDGKIVICRPDNEYADLFHALPNSYGTLGYILRAKIKLYPAKPYVQINSQRFSDPAQYLHAMLSAAENHQYDFIEGLIFSPNESYLMLSRFLSSVNPLDDIYQKNIFYKLVQTKKEINLTAKDYIFRYDPDWFWNIPETALYSLFRKYSPKTYRNSGFYKKFMDGKNQFLSFFGLHSLQNRNEETLIQDWEVPWNRGLELMQFALNHIDLRGKPWAALPIKSFKPSTLYPLKPDTMYFNLGCYCASRRESNQDPYHNTKIMDEYCYSLGGLKMLYSTTFLSQEQFASIYNGNAYQQLKSKYDPNNTFECLYEKAAC